MKTFLYFYLIVGVVHLANATVQTKVNPDKPCEIILASASGSESYTYPPMPPMGDLATRISWNWNVASGGNYSYVSLVENGLPDSLWTGYEEYDTWDTNGLTSCAVWEDDYSYGLPPYRSLIDINPEFFSGFPWEIGTLSETTTNSESLSRNSQVTIQLKTGGKSGSKLNNLFGLQASATGYRNFATDQYGDVYLIPSGSYAISPTSIQVAGKYLNTNGVVYAIYPDNATIDITPKTTENYYSVGVSAQKYHCYFTAYAEEPNPGGGRWAAYYPGEGFGHAWWCLSSDAPWQAFWSVGTTNGCLQFLNGQVGYFPVNQSIFLLTFPVPGTLELPGGGNATVQRTREVGFDGLVAGLNFTQDVATNPGMYDLYGNNCTTKTIQAGAASGVSLPNDTYPQNFGIDLQAMPPDE